MLLRLIHGVLCLSLIFGANLAEALNADNLTELQLDRLVSDACEKQIVLLGEDSNHGGGATSEAKATIVLHLVERCHFNALLFESQIYDFIDLNKRLDSGVATPSDLSDAIGGLWSTTQEMEALVPRLFEMARSRRLTLGGIDLQVGGATQAFSQTVLPNVLALNLPSGEKQACVADISRLTNWDYDESMPYDDKARDSLRRCFNAIDAGLLPNDGARRVMLDNLSSFLDMSGPNRAAARERAMFANLNWYRDRLPRGAKVIVWCATVHALKESINPAAPVATLGSMVHQALGDDAVSIGFSASRGEFRKNQQSTVALSPVAENSLEHRALQDSDAALVYVDSRKLGSYGNVIARALNYERPRQLDWWRLLDAMVVLRAERTPVYVRPAKPQQTYLDTDPTAIWR